MIRLMIATGQRRQEVSALNWSEIDLQGKLWTLPSQRSKNGKSHLVPLNTLALRELESLCPRTEGLVFTTTGKTPVSGFSRAKERIAKRTGQILETMEPGRARVYPPWRLHDLRRTLATGLQRLGVRLEVTESVLNHISGSRAGIVGVYQRHDWAEEKTEALDRWNAHLEAVVKAHFT
ncbi:site-specific integrase [Sphingomonas sp. RB56-2]|uniref:Site-specific integrase n=1 Tax=Sphingomonas brevis TaxID=2908206 RepID=A0ABT0SBS9_9SPHN|nr:site-specific integrase [Sphingomonas brevis]MCL6741569.1 site-specific integrase [Sphingomonas brevis]